MEKGQINIQFLLSLVIAIFLPPPFPMNFHPRQAAAQDSIKSFPVGLILDMETPLGRACNSSIFMGLEDFYAAHTNYTTWILLDAKDSKEDVVGAASAALDLLKNSQVKAIIGPTTSAQARFIVSLGNETQAPIISFSATSPSLAHSYTPYFIRTSLNDSMQAMVIADIIHHFGWKQVVPIYEDTEYGSGIIPFLTDALFPYDAKVPYHSIISPHANDDQITIELYKLMTMQTRVFVVNTIPSLGSRLFMKARELGMISEEYVWIVTDGMMSFLDSLEHKVLDSMQGILGVKPYVHRTTKLEEFSRKWRKKNPNSGADVSAYALWAYDTVWALAMAVEKVGPVNTGFSDAADADESTDLDMIGVSQIGPDLLNTYLNTRFNGVSGDFNLVDGQLQTSVFQILNVNGRGGREIGFWKLNSGLSRSIDSNKSESKLGPVIWPGKANHQPKGWEIPTNGKELVIGVPMKDYFHEFVKVETDSLTNRTSVSGYCIDVFEEVIKRLPYAIRPKYVPFVNASGQSAGTYNDLVDMVYFKEYDAVVGDVTIIANRSRCVDFTLPFTESGVWMIVPILKDDSSSAWFFLKPWTTDLWLATLAFFLFTGIMVWMIEHRINPDFRGPPSQQIGVIFYFAFSTLVFSHREKLLSNLARFAVIIWFFVVLILSSSYTASLTSFLTVKNLQPTAKNLDDLQKNGDCVGYQDGSFVSGLLEHHGFQKDKLRPYGSVDEYLTALSNGSKGHGVAAIFDETAFIKLFLSKHGADYTRVGPLYNTSGFGFAFPKGSPLVPDFSREILNVTQSEMMNRIEKKWFGDKNSNEEQDSISSNRLSFKNFRGLFILTGTTSGIAIVLSFILFIYHNREEMTKVVATKSSVKDKVSRSVDMFDKKDPTSRTFKNNVDVLEGDDIDTSFPFSDSSSSHHTSYHDESPSYSSVEELPSMHVVAKG